MEETLNEKATIHRTKKLKTKAFRMFKQGIRSSKVVNRILNNKRIKKQKKMICLAFSSWKRTTVINTYIKEKNLAKNARLLNTMFHEWQDYTVNWNKVRGFITDMNERKLKKSMVAWKQLLDITAKKRLAYVCYRMFLLSYSLLEKNVTALHQENQEACLQEIC